ncbi:hypothetical protein LUX39_14030 [Actinomadura madurae]|nr:replication initiator [Actinomadura madurae]MCP9966043.1 hypothetical protein [Actinomadura madurae]MCP9978528.1 hypothetical protein [Actinomadura madurae]MCQ0009942.1 hypothetical protein [Actinomadura madurae]MCQ0014733.1 hypothetical protein [Actinomadura madurae]
MPKWLENATAPLFISDRRLRHRKTFPQAATRWALDSGGFQELKDNGRWTITPAQYIDHIRRYRDQIGKLDWAAPMDWMCEPAVIHGGTLAGQHFVGTHLSVLEHQRRTVENYFHLRDLAPDLPIIPVLQGWTLVDYLTCVDLYDDAGIDLTALPLVGLGSVCRRQSTTEIEQIVTTLAGLGIRLHGFGVKTRGLDRYGHLLTSADSMAWSAEARWLQQPLPGCTGHKNCANCPRYAYQWHQRILDKLSGPTQLQISAPAPTRTRRAQSTRPAPLPSTGRSVFANDTALERAGDGYFDWLDHVWPAAGCSHPIRLFGDLDVVDNRTGELTRTLSTAAMPDGVIYKACGNRRATVCPACADTYRRDAFQLIRSGLAGGKTVPESVSSHPAVFATFTAPSFGPVHTRRVRRHTCTNKARCSCRPDSCHARRDMPRCQHGHPVACFAHHEPGEDQLGQPLCPNCYDHDHHAVWNNHSGELWRRTKQAITRYLNRLARARGLSKVRVSHGKVAEFQARGAIHFHALLRLDGVDPDDPAVILPPPPGVTAADLDDAVRYAAAHIACTTEPHPARPDGWPITWGEQVDVRIISLYGESVSDAMVAGYLAKYATKGTEITGHTSRRLHDHNIRLYADPAGTHTERLVHAAWTLGQHPGFESLRRWAHMLGFGGHFLTKARHYSVTFAALRAARVLYRRTQPQGPEYSDERFERQGDLDAETTIILARLSYVGSGWKTTGDALLANSAADQARRRHQAGREELAHELASDSPLAG